MLGSRGSALALAQVELTRAALAHAFPALALEVKTFITRGDQKPDLSLLRGGEAGGKGLFTKELEEALLAGTIDLAIHSLKDLPGHMPAGLVLAAVLERAATADTLISKHPGGFAGLPLGAMVGTSSIRRARQLQWRRPDLAICEWRGNVQTRLRKLGESSTSRPSSSRKPDWSGSAIPLPAAGSRVRRTCFTHPRWPSTFSLRSARAPLLFRVWRRQPPIAQLPAPLTIPPRTSPSAPSANFSASFRAIARSPSASAPPSAATSFT